ncbi:type I-E CRISPR-associated protein Cse2/CasB [Hansschlegelia beijingensis]
MKALDASAPPDRNDIVGKIAGRLSNVDAFGTGPLAELRRLDPAGALAEPALQRLFAKHVPEAWLRDDGVRRWGVLIHAMALAAPDRLRPTERFGAALYNSGLKERRFVNLLDAGGDDLLDVVPRAVRFLVARGGALNAFALADLIFTADRGEAGERVRRKIASDYYRAEARVEIDSQGTRA